MSRMVLKALLFVMSAAIGCYVFSYSMSALNACMSKTANRITDRVTASLYMHKLR